MTDPMPPGWDNQVPPGQPGLPPYGQPGLPQYPQPGYPPYPQPGYPPYGQPPGYGRPGYPPYGQPGYGQPGGWNAAPAPGGVPLRPLDLGDILNGAVTSARRNPKATFGLSALVMTLYGLLAAVFETVERSEFSKFPRLQTGHQLTSAQLSQLFGSIFGVLLPLSLAVVLLSLVLTSVLTGMLSIVIGRGVLGAAIGVREAMRAGRTGLVVATSLLLLLVAICVPLPVIVVVVVLALVHLTAIAAIVGVLGGIGSIFLGLLLLIRLSVTLPALVLERISPRLAIARSFELSRGSYWRMFGILLLTELMVGIATSLLSLPFTLVGAAISGGGAASMFSVSDHVSVAAVVLGAIGAVVASSIATPISAGVLVLLYTDLRMRREGFDQTLRTAAQNQQLTSEEFESVWRRPAASQPEQPATSW